MRCATASTFSARPRQILAEPPQPSEVFRIGGLVEEGSIVRGEGETIRFSVTDGGASVPVTYAGVLPDLFSENEGMVGTGSYINGVFEATEILAKHDETYMPAEVIDALKEQGVYKDPRSGLRSGDQLGTARCQRRKLTSDPHLSVASDKRTEVVRCPISIRLRQRLSPAKAAM